MGWPLAIASMLVGAYGSKVASDEHKRVAKSKADTASAGMIERQAKANRELNPLFAEAIEDISRDTEKKLFTSEDAKNLQTIQATQNRLSPSLSKGLQIGGKQSGKFSKLRSDRLGKSKSRQDLADIAFSRFLSPVGVNTIRGQAPVGLALGRSKTADEIHGDKLINDIRISEIQPNSGTLAFADALRIAGMAMGMYNMGSSFGTEAMASDPNALQTASPNLTGFSSNVYSTAPWYEQAFSAINPSYIGDVGSSSMASANLFQPTSSLIGSSPDNIYFSPSSYGSGASRGIAPSNAINRFTSSNIPSPAWGFGASRDRLGDISAGNWWGGRG